MPKLTADEIITQRHKRNFIQFGGPLPNAAVKYAGQDTQYMSIQGVTINDLGDVSPILVPDPRVQGGYRTVNRSRTAPDLSQATLVLYEKHASIPWQLFAQNCPFNMYELTGVCKDLSDFNNGWNDYVLIYPSALVTSRDLGDRSAWDSDDAQEDSLSLTFGGKPYPVGALTFANKAATPITTEAKDVVLGTQIRCGDCGVPNDGTRFIYIVCKGVASPATKPYVVYSLDGGATWTSVTIATAANAEDVVAIDIVGDKLVVASKAGGTGGASCLYVSSLNTITGAPSSSFTKVTPAAFTVANTVNDMYVLSTTEVFFAADGGYIYKSADVLSDMNAIDAGSATVQNLSRIAGAGDAIYAAGASGAVVKSTNRGQTFATTTTSPGAAVNQALCVKDALTAWVGNASGVLYYTLDGGETWVTKGFTGQAVVAIQDIYFSTDEVGFIAFTVTGPAARVATTINGGERWVDSSQNTPRLISVTSGATFNRIASPMSGEASTDANTVVFVGLGTSPDGVASLGVANRV